MSVLAALGLCLALQATEADPLAHLRDHLRSGVPVVVRYQVEGDVLVALGVDDS